VGGSRATAQAQRQQRFTFPHLARNDAPIDPGVDTAIKMKVRDRAVHAAFVLARI
jgi:hypothetical protein